MGRIALVCVVLAALAVGAGSAGAGSNVVSPCGSVSIPTWSPDGKSIAFVGQRWPLPAHAGRAAGQVLRAVCVAGADGTNAQPVRYTVCSERCGSAFADSPSQLSWTQPNLLLADDDYRVFEVAFGSKPQLLRGQTGSLEEFSVDSAGDRVAAGSSNCVQCKGPVTVLSVPSGKLVARVGGTKLDNVEATISPNGEQVAFFRYKPGDPGRPLGIWTASADGSHLQRLEKSGELPLWSPGGDEIAYRRGSAVLLVSPEGGKSTMLVPRGVWTVFGWSPDGKQLAYEDSTQQLRVVDVATGKVRRLLKLHFAPTAAWSPDSQRLLVNTWPKRTGCSFSLWSVPVDGARPQLLRHC
jgi:Tol biopolymer transport system component